MKLAIGLMSGTSMDGIDATIIETDGKYAIKELGFSSLQYDSTFQMTLKSAEYVVKKFRDIDLAKAHYSTYSLEYFRNIGIDSPQPELSLDEIISTSTLLHYDLVERLLRESSIDRKNISAIGYHGQTVYHAPHDGKSLILADPLLLSKKTKIKVVSNFRDNDIKNGGQGAPFAPIYHQALAVRDNLLPVAIVNCGGIANISLIKDNNPLHIIGFDVGPGNALIDNFVRNKTKGKMQMDFAGELGLKGQLYQEIQENLYKYTTNNNYYSLPYPKSLDINDLILPDFMFNLSIEDGCRNLAAFTANNIANSLHGIKKVILSGGGWKNLAILKELKDRSDAQIHFADDIGWNNSSLEAQIFAYLAVRKLFSMPASYPNITGCKNHDGIVAGEIFE